MTCVYAVYVVTAEQRRPVVVYAEQRRPVVVYAEQRRPVVVYAEQRRPVVLYMRSNVRRDSSERERRFALARTTIRPSEKGEFALARTTNSP